MLKRFLLRLQDMKTIGKLISGADEQAHIAGKQEPGAEHFVLSALSLEDGTAKRVFQKIGVDADRFRNAINQQYSDALRTIGISNVAYDMDQEPVEQNTMLHTSQPSGQALMKSLYAIKSQDKDRPLLGAHVIRVAAELERGIVARAFSVMDIDRGQLAKIAQEELELR